MAVAVETAEVVIRRLSVLSGEELRRKAAARTLAALEPTEATALIHELFVLARHGHPSAGAVVGSFTRAIELEAASIPHIELLRRAASLREVPAVEAVFAEGEAVLAYDARAAARADAKLFTLPLGVLKSRARLTRNPDELTRLAIASNPAIVREVLRNSRLTEDVVVRIAARRPARPEPLVEIWRSERWSVRPGVRRALAFNPYLPPDVGAKIVPLLPKADLRELAQDNGVHPSLREQAMTLLSL